ncbi:DUF4352 domain-containing protein [Paenibacillus sp. FSL W8-0186]|uniref:DUF4352 domain-containing protein n=1 Tax=Paenibacillus woosongensis TaxID=307580 RepID=A0ABQ4MUW7_9BACL|nr:DUF4352 domain-containing protein [Paenibacillus woosongensis]GIP59706.1 hypothetical protein J15TS10_35200 [Paenibacillus woosongensis]
MKKLSILCLLFIMVVAGCSTDSSSSEGADTPIPIEETVSVGDMDITVASFVDHRKRNRNRIVTVNVSAKIADDNNIELRTEYFTLVDAEGTRYYPDLSKSQILNPPLSPVPHGQIHFELPRNTRSLAIAITNNPLSANAEYSTVTLMY